ncbi:MAG: group I intron-associated PD-(D/E)XK endonuclease [Dehalococcoidales bacterium]
MNTTQFGALGESKTITKLMELGFDVFTPAFDRNSEFDIIACKDNKLYKIQVKSTSSAAGDSYVVRLASNRPNNSKRTRMKKFKPSSCDILVVYIYPLDVLCFIDPIELTNRPNAINMRLKPTKHANGRKQWIISDYNSFPSTID